MQWTLLHKVLYLLLIGLLKGYSGLLTPRTRRYYYLKGLFSPPKSDLNAVRQWSKAATLLKTYSISHVHWMRSAVHSAEIFCLVSPHSIQIYSQCGAWSTRAKKTTVLFQAPCKLCGCHHYQIIRFEELKSSRMYPKKVISWCFYCYFMWNLERLWSISRTKSLEHTSFDKSSELSSW